MAREIRGIQPGALSQLLYHPYNVDSA